MERQACVELNFLTGAPVCERAAGMLNVKEPAVGIFHINPGLTIHIINQCIMIKLTF